MIGLNFFFLCQKFLGMGPQCPRRCQGIPQRIAAMSWRCDFGLLEMALCMRKMMKIDRMARIR